ncbi:MAG: hypothetical protein ACI4IS_02865 [Acutalibacteraceae bacterium]
MQITVENLDSLISRLEKYRANLQIKINLLLEKLSVLGAFRARVDFSNAMYAGDNDVEISVDKTETGYQITAKGQAVLFIEFGTGILNPEHPQSEEFGFAHGTYGKGKGANEKGWVYVGEQGNAGQTIREGVYRTYGNPPAKAMYNASKDMKAEIYRIAREVFA